MKDLEEGVAEVGMNRFTAGFDARATHADAWSLTFSLAGRAERVLPTGNQTITAGTATLQRPGFASHWQVPADSEGYQAIWFIFRPYDHWSPLLAWSETPRDVVDLELMGSPLSRQVKGAMLRAYRISRSPYEHRTALMLNAIEAALLFCHSAITLKQRARDPRIEAVIAYLMRHLHTTITMEEAMRVACLSRSRLAELFRQETGESVVGYHERERMARARSLLTLTQMPIKGIAWDLGFEDPAYFSRRFAAAHGASPRSYRDAAR